MRELILSFPVLFVIAVFVVVLGKIREQIQVVHLQPLVKFTTLALCGRRQRP